MVSMAIDITTDIRLDPRVRRILELVPTRTLQDVTSREVLVEQSNSPEAVAGMEMFRSIHDACDAAAPSAGLEVTRGHFASEPDGNPVNVQVIRPDGAEPLACVYYIHGGGMATMSCFDGMYRGWGKIHRRQRRGRGHGGLPQLPGPFVGIPGGAVPGRAERLRLRGPMGGRPRRRPGDRPAANRRRR